MKMSIIKTISVNVRSSSYLLVYAQFGSHRILFISFFYSKMRRFCSYHCYRIDWCFKVISRMLIDQIKWPT